MRVAVGLPMDSITAIHDWPFHTLVGQNIHVSCSAVG